MSSPALDQPEPTEHRFERFLVAESTQGRKRDRTRAAIRIAACRFLDAQPLAALTVADICRAAGVAHGTFYLYYADRHLLVADLLLDFVDFMQQGMRAASRRSGGDRVRATMRTYYDLFEWNPGLMRCLISHLDTFPEAMQAFQTLNRNWVMTVVAAHQRRNPDTSLPRDELIRRAYALGGMVDQYLTAILLNGDPTLRAVSGDRERVIDTLTGLWQKGFSE